MSDDSQPGLHQRVADALTRLRTLVRSHETNAAFAATISPLQARALVILGRRGDLRVGEIAKELLVTFGTISVALTVLEQKGFVKKFADPEEHRAVRVKLTLRGRNAAKQASSWHASVLEASILTLPKDESAGLLATLLKLLLAVEANQTTAPAHMCLSCNHLRLATRGQKRHHCTRLDVSFDSCDLRVECPQHERAATKKLADVARAFRPLK